MLATVPSPQYCQGWRVSRGLWRGYLPCYLLPPATGLHWAVAGFHTAFRLHHGPGPGRYSLPLLGFPQPIFNIYLLVSLVYLDIT